MSTDPTDQSDNFFACDHSWSNKYVTSSGLICLDCNTNWQVIPWDQPGSDPLGDLHAMLRRWGLPE